MRNLILSICLLCGGCFSETEALTFYGEEETVMFDMVSCEVDQRTDYLSVVLWNNEVLFRAVETPTRSLVGLNLPGKHVQWEREECSVFEMNEDYIQFECEKNNELLIGFYQLNDCEIE